MLLFFLSNLGMGGGGFSPTFFVDADAGTLIDGVDAGLLEVDADAGTLIIV